jgi:hypothetical protein
VNHESSSSSANSNGIHASTPTPEQPPTRAKSAETCCVQVEVTLIPKSATQTEHAEEEPINAILDMTSPLLKLKQQLQDDYQRLDIDSITLLREGTRLPCDKDSTPASLQFPKRSLTFLKAEIRYYPREN